MIQEWIHNLQNLDEQKKFRVAVVMAAVAMVVVIGLWWVYFKTLVKPQQEAANVSSVDTDEFSLWQSIKNKFTGKSEYDITPTK